MPVSLNPEAPISSLISYINSMSATALNGVAGTMISTIAPFGGVVFGIYIIFMMWGYMRGTESDPVQDFLLKFFSWAVVIGYGLNAATYTSEILPIVTGLGESFLKMFGSGANATAMDSLAISVISLINDGFMAIRDKNYGISDIGTLIGEYGRLIFYAIVLLFGIVPFLVLATVTVIIANIGSQIIGAVGPLFFLALLFPATRQYFSSWLNSVLSYSFIPLFVAIISMLAIGVTNGILSILPGQSLLDANIFMVFFAAFANMVFMFLIQQVSSIASSLSSGGINAGMAHGGLGGIAGAIKSSVSGSSREVSGISRANHSRLDSRHARQNRNNSIKQNKPKAG